VRQARERRKERGLTQQHLAALANVGRSTLNRFENQSGDVTLSSVLRILGVLDMLDRKQQGRLVVKRSEAESGGFDVAFTPSFGGEPRARKALASGELLEKFLSALSVPETDKKRVLSEVESRGSAIFPASVSQAKIEETWPRI
jgi:transcriptional regulator with XRE-family HTH domain